MFNQPLPVPSNAVAFTAEEKEIIGKYLSRAEAAKQQMSIAQEALNDVCMTIAARAGCTTKTFSLSADLGFMIPKE